MITDNRHYENVGGKVTDIEDQIPFKIPDTWAWVRVGNLFQHNTGKALNSSNMKGLKRQYITTSNLYWDSFRLSSLKEMLFTDGELEKFSIKRNDLLVCEGGDIGRAAIWKYDVPMCIQNHIHRLRSYVEVETYFFYYVFFLYKHTGLIGSKGIGIQGLSSNMLAHLLFPLPPLTEQKRVVAAINCLFEILTQIDKEQAELSNLATLAKSKILDLAMRGKLVPQDPNDEPASELLKRLSPSHKPHYQKKDRSLPYIIPKSWTWTTVDAICSKVFNGKPPVYANQKTNFGIIGQAANQESGIDLKFTKYCESSFWNSMPSDFFLLRGDVLLNSLGRGTVGRIGIIENIGEGLLTDGHLFVLRAKDYAIEKLIFYYFKNRRTQIEEIATGTTNQAFLKIKDVMQWALPLPPLTELKRIIGMIEAVFSIIDPIIN